MNEVQKSVVSVSEMARIVGLSVSANQIEAAVKECFPEGIQKLDSGEVVRAVFLNVKRQQPSA